VTGLATAREVADYLRTTPNQLNRLRYEGSGPAYRTRHVVSITA